MAPWRQSGESSLTLFSPKKANEEKKNLPCLSGGDRRMTTEKVLISGGDLPSTTFAIFVVYTRAEKLRLQFW